jgi:hypothetical protein
VRVSSRVALILTAFIAMASAAHATECLSRIQHAMFEMVMSRVLAIACGHEDAIDLDRLRHDPLMKLAVGRCPESGQPLASQSTISRLENAPSKTEAARLTAALLDQARFAVSDRGLREDDRACDPQGSRPRIEGASAHASPRLRLCPRQQGTRYPGDSGVVGASVDYRGLCGSGSKPV